MQNNLDTIVAIATPPGRGGVGIVRVSGSDIATFIESIVGRTLVAREATFCRFKGEGSDILDEGVAIWFPAPHSFTGEMFWNYRDMAAPLFSILSYSAASSWVRAWRGQVNLVSAPFSTISSI